MAEFHQPLSHKCRLANDEISKLSRKVEELEKQLLASQTEVATLKKEKTK